VQGHPLARVLGHALPACGIWKSVSQQKPAPSASRHGTWRAHAGTRSARYFALLFASSLWPEADSCSLNSALLVQGSRAPLGPSLRQRRDSAPTRGRSSPSPSSLLLNSRSEISFVFHPSSALHPSLHQLWGNITVSDRVAWCNVLSPGGETEAGRDFRSRSGLHGAH